MASAPSAVGSDSEFETFFATHRQLYWRIAFAIGGSSATADDVTQEAFSAIYARWDRIQATKVEAYCRTVLVNTALSAVRKQKREHLTDEPELMGSPASSPTMADPALVHDLRIDLVALLRNLPPGYRAVIALRYLEDLSVAEVASVLDITAGTVKSQSARALALMRQQVESSARRQPALVPARPITPDSDSSNTVSTERNP
ncbi:SigE family RNA polymerase sigma factor [Nocardioides hankookensis]|uniref:RNA polymerase sigma factor n=1 Tax=Nocardioides hankookensis TaxID=443157 RepID=A0ABW1LFG2_9ACTN